jgi:hypothetical protein
MRSNTVAFRGVGQVVEAYKSNDIGPWAICNGSGKVMDIMFAYEEDDVAAGAEMLSEILKRMQAGSSSASFALRTYKLKAGEDIMSNTAWYRSFSFKLYEDEEFSPFDAGRSHYAKQADEKIRLLQEQIDLMKKQMEQDEEEDEKPEGVAGIVYGIFNDPIMKPIFMQAVAGIVSKIVPMPARPAAVAGIGNGAQAEPMQSVLESGQPEKVQQAINLLCTQDAKLGDHLLKLADISIKNPGQFQSLLGMLAMF